MFYICTYKYKHSKYVLKSTNKMPKIEQFDKSKAVQMALDVFWEKGYKGTSLTDLTESLGIGKGSFYNTFKSKRVLFEQCIHVFQENSVKNLKEKLHAEEDAKKGLHHYLKVTLEDAINDQKHKGCFMTNIATELGASDEDIAHMLNDYYAKMKVVLTDYLKNRSDLQNKTIKEITDTIITFFIGMTVEVKLQNNKSQIEKSIDHLIESFF